MYVIETPFTQEGKFSLLGRFEDGTFGLYESKTTSLEDIVEKLPMGQKVREAMKTIYGSDVCLFSSAIMSGRTEMVMLVHELVVAIFGAKTEEVCGEKTRLA